MLWKDMDWWASGECQVVDEKLKELTKRKVAWNPGRKLLYRALDATPFDSVKCVLVGQDPYPEASHACGLAFSIPPDMVRIPVTLFNVMKELHSDVDVWPINGDLSEWCQEGVLLWNVYPSCLAGQSLSHKWPEYEVLTGEIFRRLSERGIVFAPLGNEAHKITKRYVSEDDSCIVWASHPSPRGNQNSSKPFLGSRLFSTINAELRPLGHEPIDWRTHADHQPQ